VGQDSTLEPTLHEIRGGGSGPGGSYLLLHGLGGAAGVWTPFGQALEARTGAGWVAVDLPGHGRSEWATPAGFGSWAGAVARAVADVPGPLTVVGHSLGGAIALLLASGLYGLDVRRCVTVGTKISWTEQELARAAKVAAGTPREHADPDAALAFWRRVAGVSPAAELPAGLAQEVVRENANGSWVLRYDQRAAGLGAAPVAELHALVSAAAVELVAARGVDDPMLSEDDLRALVADPVTVPGAAHSPHLEAVEAFVQVVTEGSR
jgi:pimeloyl-ACP methyl ester carboxylesterase